MQKRVRRLFTGVALANALAGEQEVAGREDRLDRHFDACSEDEDGEGEDARGGWKKKVGMERFAVF